MHESLRFFFKKKYFNAGAVVDVCRKIAVSQSPQTDERNVKNNTQKGNATREVVCVDALLLNHHFLSYIRIFSGLN